MNKLLTTITLLGLSSCESTVGPSFEEMSETELATYNASLPTDEQVICQEEIRGFTGGRYQRWPKLCLTVREINSPLNSAMWPYEEAIRQLPLSARSGL
jgi:hypothetical protein